MVVFDVQQDVDGLIELEKGQARLVVIDCGFQYSMYIINVVLVQQRRE